jgi:hypothetical protein
VAERLVAGLPLSQALIQYRQRLFDEPRLCTLDILLRQHLSLNDPFGGGPIDDTCDAGVRWPPAAAECPTSRHILDHNVPPRKTDCVLRPSGVRARPKVDPLTYRVAPSSRSIMALFFRSVPASGSFAPACLRVAANSRSGSGITANRTGSVQSPRPARSTPVFVAHSGYHVSREMPPEARLYGSVRVFLACFGG